SFSTDTFKYFEPDAAAPDTHLDSSAAPDNNVAFSNNCYATPKNNYYTALENDHYA
ncbi:10065_t:CDS:1, partial [Dentiscutata heterogama]